MRVPKFASHAANQCLTLFLLTLVLVSTARGGDETAKNRYVLTYPVADAFCVPASVMPEDVNETVMEVNGGLVRAHAQRRLWAARRHEVQGQNLLHLGADVAWLRASEPVFAIANGVVADLGRERNRLRNRSSTIRRVEETGRPSGATWTSLSSIALPTGRSLLRFTDIYRTSGSLKKGKLLAGQAIGAVGRAGVENGGYKPHLHFGIREGRRVEEGDTLLSIQVGGESFPIRLVKLGETEIEIAADRRLPERVQLLGHMFEITNREGKYFLPAAMLQKAQSPNFAIVGYGLSTKGGDPTEFLREKNAGQPAGP